MTDVELKLKLESSLTNMFSISKSLADAVLESDLDSHAHSHQLEV